MEDIVLRHVVNELLGSARDLVRCSDLSFSHLRGTWLRVLLVVVLDVLHRLLVVGLLVLLLLVLVICGLIVLFRACDVIWKAVKRQHGNDCWLWRYDRRTINQ